MRSNCMGRYRKKILRLFDTDMIFLFLSLNTFNIRDRRTAFPQILKDRFGLQAKVIDERSVKTFDGIMRIGALIADYSQVSVVLEIIHTLQYHAFAAIAPAEPFSTTAKSVLNHFQSGSLTKPILHDCCCQVINGNGMFLHVLVGSDGCSVNQFYNNASKSRISILEDSDSREASEWRK